MYVRGIRKQIREYLSSRIKYLETKSKNNVINDSRGRRGRKVSFFFFIVKKVVICLRIPTVCWMDGFLCQRKYTAESLAPKPSAVDGRDALWKVKVRSYDSSNFVRNVSIRR